MGLLFSGGLDSAVLLAHLADSSRRVQPFYVRSGLVWESAELLAIERFVEAFACDDVLPLVTLRMPLADLYQGHWSITGHAVPAADTPDEAVYLPGRNALLLIKVAIWCQLRGISEVALGALKSNPFPDATPSFFRALESTVSQATGETVRFSRPFADFDKRRVMRLGRDLPLVHTFSCIAPVAGRHCGQCNKCAERRAAFRWLATDDPTRYAVDCRGGMTVEKTRPASSSRIVR